MVGIETLNTDALLSDDITPIPLYVELIDGKYKGLVGYTFFWEFPMVVTDRVGNEYIITISSHVKNISKEQYKRKIKG